MACILNGANDLSFSVTAQPSVLDHGCNPRSCDRLTPVQRWRRTRQKERSWCTVYLPVVGEEGWRGKLGSAGSTETVILVSKQTGDEQQRAARGERDGEAAMHVLRGTVMPELFPPGRNGRMQMPQGISTVHTPLVDSGGHVRLK